MRDFSKYTFHWALGGTDRTGGIEQNPYELDKLLDFIDEKQIKSFFEIGMAQGKLNQFMWEYGLNTWGVNPVRLDGVQHLIGKSQDKKIIQLVEMHHIKIWDMIFVDGDHSYEAVKADFENYKGKCKYMAFHDILGLRDCEGVKKLWEELKYSYNNMEIIAPSNPSGIGIICLHNL